MTIAIPFDNSYARLPARFFSRTRPEAAPAPRLLRLNRPLAAELGLDAAALASPEGIAVLAGSNVPAGAEPIAMAYAGHQFGHFVPELGDGRAVLIGEVVDRAGRRRDIQLKGAGRTVFSRRGDGRAALGPVLREYVVSEAMAALGISTTRALAAVTTGAAVFRERFLPGAVIARVALSHVRVGTFQYFAHRGDVEAVRALAGYCIDRLYPEAAGADNPPAAFFAAVAEAQARLVARWLAVGFIHGVMNTDNMAISGETIDYGPCAFMDAYDPRLVLSSIDQLGRYAYGNQPQIAQWNLARLGECLLPLIDADRDAAVKAVVEALSGFAGTFEAAYYGELGRKIGLAVPAEGDVALVRGLLAAMQAGGADFTLAFRRLADVAADSAAEADFLALFEPSAAAGDWLAAWRLRLAGEKSPPAEIAAAMRAVNPAYIPRNHLVEQAIAAAVDEEDLTPFETLAEVLSRPYEDQPGREALGAPPKPEERVLATFCGT